jgi:hypothetical protein
MGLAVLGAMLFFQPLNLIARLRLRATAEHLCDDWAIRHTGSPIALGRCLTDIASWTGGTPLPPLASTPAMAEGGSPLVERVRRIASGIHATPEIRFAPVLPTLALLAVTAAAAPVVTTRPPAAEAQTPRLLAGADTSDIIRTMEALAMADSSALVRQESAAGLSDFAPHPEAEAALIRLMAAAGDPVVRAEAAQQLDEFPTDAAVAALLTTVLREHHPGVRSNALDVLDDFSMPAATEALLRIAREHPLADVKQAALAALSDGSGA